MTAERVREEKIPTYFLTKLFIFITIGAVGFIARLAFALGYVNNYGTYVLPVMYLTGSFAVLVIAAGGTFSRKAVLTVLGASLVYSVLCLFTRGSGNALLITAVLLAEIPLYGLMEYLLLRSCGREVRMGRLLVKVLVMTCLALAVCRLVSPDSSALAFYLPEADAYIALRADLINTVSLVLIFVLTIDFMILFLTEGLGNDVPRGRLFSLISLSLLILFAMLIFRIICPGTDPLAFGFGQSRGGRVDTASAELYFNEETNTSSESNAINAAKKPLGRHACALYHSQKDWERRNAFYTFRSANGLSHVHDLDQKTYVTTLADELILARRDSEWTILLPRETAGMEKDDQLTGAIWEGIESGRMLLPVNCIDYLLRVDHERTMEALERWSSGSFTDGEAWLGHIYNLKAVSEWAKDKLTESISR